MELAAGKKEYEDNSSTQPPQASDEDRERVTLDLKAGLHPLRASLASDPFPCSSPVPLSLNSSLCLILHISDSEGQGRASCAA
ncbi:hypothetical protein OROHE_022777 [Orobanche hederae]